MIHFEDFSLGIMVMVRPIALNSALCIDDSFRRRFSGSWFWNIAAQPIYIPYVDPSISM